MFGEREWRTMVGTELITLRIHAYDQHTSVKLEWDYFLLEAMHRGLFTIKQEHRTESAAQMHNI